MKNPILPLLAAAGQLFGAPIPIVNPSGEINGGASPAPISAAAVLGWDSDGGQVIRNGTDYGNGAWRLSFEDSQEIRQMTEHAIEAGASYSLRFDAAMFITGGAGDSLPLIGGDLRNGNFNADVSAADSRAFADTPSWTNLGGPQTTEATRSNLTADGSRNAALHQNGTRVFANDTGHLITIDTHSEKSAVIRVLDESDGSLVHAMRVRGNLFRPPVYDNAKTYRVEISYGDGPVTETCAGLAPVAPVLPAIHSFSSLRPSIALGAESVLRWDVSGPATLNGTETAAATVRVFPVKADWLADHFTPGELGDPEISGGGADPDGDGFTNDEEYRFQTNPRDGSSRPVLSGSITNVDGVLRADFSSSYPLDAAGLSLFVESSGDLAEWKRLPSNSYRELSRDNLPGTGTSRFTIRLNETLPGEDPEKFYRVGWELGGG